MIISHSFCYNLSEPLTHSHICLQIVLLLRQCDGVELVLLHIITALHYFAAMNTLVSSFRSFTLGNQILRSCEPAVIKWHPSYFHTTPVLCAEPLKKKKKIDPQILRERAEKKIKRIQRDIRRLEKVAKKFKPLAELEIPKKAVRDSERVRPPPVLSETEITERAELKLLWAVHKRKEHVAEIYAIQRIINAQEKAMDALQEMSPELYEEALQPDPMFIPFKMKGPVDTPVIDNYDYPGGDYIDVTKQYVPIIPLDPKKQRKLGLKKK